MGVKGLLSLMYSTSRRRHISDLRGFRIGVDAHVWLHRSVFNKPERLVYEDTEHGYIEYFLRKAHWLKDHGVTPLFVFDGSDPPLKSGINSNRAVRRVNSFDMGVQLLGSTYRAFSHFASSTDIDHMMVHEVRSALEAHGFEAVIAPYESDSQLTHLLRVGELDLIISEDSDLLIYGGNRVLFRLDLSTGFSVEIDCPLSASPFMTGLTPDGSLLACILAGCDYGPRLPGIGIKRAIDIASEVDGGGRLVDSLNRRGLAVDDSLLTGIQDSRLAFLHPVVFCPLTDRAVHLTPTDRPDIDYIVGRRPDDVTARRLYRGG
jgi:exonuclease-1